MAEVAWSEKPRYFQSAVQPRSLVAKLPVVLAGLLLICIASRSQINLGRILGPVTDLSGGAISGVIVTITNRADGHVPAATQDAESRVCAL
jgi:hypothetical protein